MKAELNNKRYFTACTDGIKEYPDAVYPFEWRSFKFIAHQRPLTNGAITAWDEELYNATEVTSGMSIGAGGYTPEEAMANCIATLEAHGEEALRRAIALGNTMFEAMRNAKAQGG